MIKLKRTCGSFIAIVNLLPLQAAEHPEKTCNEKLVLSDWITLPHSLHTFGQGEITEKVFLKNKDYITLDTFKQHIKYAHKQDLPWIMVAYLWLSNEEGLARDYADAIAFNKWHIDFTKENYKKKCQWKDTMHLLHHTPICLPSYYACTVSQTVHGQVEVTYLGSLNELQDKTSALRALLEAASLPEPSPAAENLLAIYFHHNKDYKRAEKWYKQAAVKENVEAKFNLGLLYNQQEDTYEAQAYWETAAAEGSIKAMFNLGVLYYNKRDKNKAQAQWKVAAAKGNIKARVNFGLSLYKKGYTAKAEEQLRIAAAKGSRDAEVNLGTFYYYEDKDKDKAREWWKSAAAKGSGEAKLNLEMLQKKSA